MGAANRAYEIEQTIEKLKGYMEGECPSGQELLAGDIIEKTILPYVYLQGFQRLSGDDVDHLPEDSKAAWKRWALLRAIEAALHKIGLSVVFSVYRDEHNTIHHNVEIKTLAEANKEESSKRLI